MNISPAKSPNDAAMFDIDDTLIESSTGKLKENVYKLYLQLQKMGYKMVIITARPGFQFNVESTQRELSKLNITYDELVFTPPSGKSLYKRQSMYNYIISVGDMDTDLTDSKYAIKISR
jgi:hypothetical protein